MRSNALRKHLLHFFHRLRGKGEREGLLLNFRPTMNFLDSDEPNESRAIRYIYIYIYAYPIPDQNALSNFDKRF